MKNILSLLKTRRFLPLFITQFLDTFSNNAFKNALIIWITYDIVAKSAYHSSMIITIAAGLFILPFFLFSTLAGQLADKYRRGWLTQKIQLLGVFLIVSCSIGFYLQNIYLLLAILFLTGVQATFFGPLKYSLLPECLSSHELVLGNALIEGGTFLAILLGTLFGGLIIEIQGGVWYLTIILIALSIFSWLSSKYIPINASADPSLKIAWNIVKETSHIIGYARNNKIVWITIIAISWFWGLGIIFLTQFPTYTKQIIHGNEHIVTLFLAIFSIGIGLGSMLCNKLLKGSISMKLFFWSCLGMSTFIIDLFFASQHYHVTSNLLNAVTLYSFMQQWQGIRIIIDLFGLAICSGLYIVPLYAIMQHNTANTHISRMIAVNNIMNALYMILASIGTLIIFSFGANVVTLFLIVSIVNLLIFCILTYRLRLICKAATTE